MHGPVTFRVALHRAIRRVTMEPLGYEGRADRPSGEANRPCSSPLSPSHHGRFEAPAGEAVASEDVAAALALLEVITIRLNELHEWRDRLGQQWRHSIVQLALAIAEHVIRREVQADRWGIDQLLSECLTRCGVRPLSIQLHPDDLQLLRREHADWLAEQLENDAIAITADLAVPRGDCRVDLGGHGIVAGIGADLEAIREALQLAGN